MSVFETVTDLIGKTPLLHLRGVEKEEQLNADLLGKLEYIGGHAKKEHKGDEQFEIDDGRTVKEIYKAIKDAGLQPVMSD